MDYKFCLKYIVIKIISYIPRNSKIAVYGAWFGNNFSDNSKYMYLFNNRHELFNKNIWISKNKKLIRDLNSIGFEAYYYKSLKGIYYQIFAKYAFVCTGLDDVLSICISGALIINLWHGVPLKKICNDDKKCFSTIPERVKRINSIISKNEYSICTSKAFEKIYQSAFNKDATHVLNLGQPRNDVFFDNSLEILSDDMLNLLSLNKKMILYMPTHRNEGSSSFPIHDVLNLDKIDQICENFGYIFIIKLHYYHKNQYIDISNYNNVYNYTSKNIDSQLLLKYTDILITDYSSCYIDFLLLNKPLIFYPFDLDDYIIKDREMYFEYSDVITDEFVLTKSQLESQILKSINNPNLSKKQIELKNFFYDFTNQGVVTEKIYRVIKNL